jgi:hypothetical protein
MITKPYYTLTIKERDQFIEFLKEASTETTQPAHTNMYDNDWHNKNNTLMYILEYTDRFRHNGFYQVVFDNDKVIASGGAYTSDFSKDIAILGTRTWIHKDYRHKLISREQLLPNEKKWAIESGFKAIVLTFNDYNKNLMKLWHRTRLGESRPNRESHHFGFNGVTEIEFPVDIQYTKQYVLCERLDPTFKYDWSSIQWK